MFTDAFLNDLLNLDDNWTVDDVNFTGVANALRLKYNNAMAERMNGKIQEIKTASRGYRTFESFRSAVLFFYGGLDLYPKINNVSLTSW